MGGDKRGEVTVNIVWDQGPNPSSTPSWELGDNGPHPPGLVRVSGNSVTCTEWLWAMEET